MKGSEIISRFERAKAIVAKREGHLREIGAYLRNEGYDIHYDGFSVCTFGERDVKILYSADNCWNDFGRSPWRMCPAIRIADGASLPMQEISKDEDYDVPDNTSVAQRFDNGDVQFDWYDVYENSPTSTKLMGEFHEFKNADEYAKNCCQKEIDRLNRDPDWRKYTPPDVRNNPQRAKERCELRHYKNYDCDGYYYWYSVKGVGK